MVSPSKITQDLLTETDATMIVTFLARSPGRSVPKVLSNFRNWDFLIVSFQLLVVCLGSATRFSPQLDILSQIECA